MIRQRPLVVMMLVWMLGIAFSREFSIDSSQTLFLVVISLVLIATCALFRLKSPEWLWLIILLIFGLAILRENQTRLPLDQLYGVLDKLSPLQGVVDEYPAKEPGRTSFVIRPNGLPGKIQIFYYHPHGALEDIRYGDRIALSLKLQIPWEFDDFDYRRYLLSREIWAVGTTWSAREIRIMGRETGDPLLQWGFTARNDLFGLINAYLPEPSGSLLKSLLLGDRGSLEDEVEAEFRDAGVLHVLAVSGLNIAILIAPLLLLFRSIRLTWALRYVLLIPVVLLYLILVGFKVSLVRAALMFGFVALGWVLAERGLILRRWIDPLQGLSLAALAILIISPSALYDVSFQLSFAATAGIVLGLDFLTPRLREWQQDRLAAKLARDSYFQRGVLRLVDGLVSLTAVSLAAQIAVAPVLALHFQRVYLVSLLANLLVVPLATIALWGGMILLGAALLVPGIAPSLGNLELLLLSLLADSASFFAHIPWGFLPVGPALQSALIVALPDLLTGWIQHRQASLRP